MTHSPVQNFIDGKFVDPVNDHWLDNLDPARGTIAGRVANSDADDLQQAVDGASAAAPAWGKLPVEQRSAVLNRMADLIDQRCESLARIESEDGGKPIKRARLIEIPRAATNFRFYAAAAISFASELHDSRGQQAINMTFRQPLGIVGCISPWNLPLYLLTWKVAPALATGNCVIAKPSELTPRTAFELGQIAIDAGLPPGVLNIIQGAGPTAGQALLEHPRVKAISFTGGTSTGRHVASTVAPQLKKYSLELGGKNPNIVFADANYDQALRTSVMTAFANQGQICLCGVQVACSTRNLPAIQTGLCGLGVGIETGRSGR
jgi:aminomuconate-semialdehyde/2-hydroxymuconate-6-semialdehyde dehydrogenase